MPTLIKRSFIFCSYLLGFCLIAGISLYFWLMHLTHQVNDPIREYPAWEDYVNYQQSAWIPILEEYINSGFEKCIIGAERHYQFLGFNFTLRRLKWCFQDGYVMRTEMDFLDRTINYNEWLVPSPASYRNVASHTPNGPYSFAFLKKPSLEKHVYERSITPQEVYDAFVELITKHEAFPENKYFFVNKWDRPVRVEVVDLSDGLLLDGKTLTENVEDYVQELASISGLDIRLGEVEYGQGSVVVYFFPLDKPELVKQHLNEWVMKVANMMPDLKPEAGKYTEQIINSFDEAYKYILAKRYECTITSLEGYPKNAMDFYAKTTVVNKQLDRIYIPLSTANSGRLCHCIQEEVGHVMGFSNDWRDAESIFNDYSPYDQLTDLDKLLLRILYDPEIAQGTTRTFIHDPLWRIIQKYEKMDYLKTIKKRVYQPAEYLKPTGKGIRP